MASPAGLHVACKILPREVFTRGATCLINPQALHARHGQRVEGEAETLSPGSGRLPGVLAWPGESLSKLDKSHILCSTRRWEERHLSPSKFSGLMFCFLKPEQ